MIDIEDGPAAQAPAPLELRHGFDERGAVVSYSQLTLHRKCPQAWLYRNGYRLAQDRPDTSPYATLGSWWSVLRAAEALERGREKGSLVPGLIPEELTIEVGTELGSEPWAFPTATVTVLDVLNAARRAWKAISADARDEFQDALGESLTRRLLNMFDLWGRATAEERTNEAPISVEMYVERQLPGTETRLIGYVDEVYVDQRRGMTVIRDHKTLKDLGRGTSALDDLMDSQLQLYAWLATPALREHGVDAPRAVGYDRTRSVAPKTPVLTATGTLSKSVTDYDLGTYRGWAIGDTRPWKAEEGSAEDGQERALEAFVAEHGLSDEQAEKVAQIAAGPLWGKVGEFYVSGAKAGQPKFGTYQLDEKVVEELSSPAALAKWHTRTLTPVQKNVIRAHLRAAVDTAEQLASSQERASKTGEAPRNLSRQACQFCDYASLCRAQMIGGPEGDYDLAEHGLKVRPERA